MACRIDRKRGYMKLGLGVFNKAFDFVVKFLKETRVETGKVTWPGKQYIIAATIVVLFIVIIAGLFIAFLDYVLAAVFKVIIKV